MKKDDIYYPYKPRLQWKVRLLLAFLSLSIIYLMVNQFYKAGNHEKNNLWRANSKTSKNVNKDISARIVKSKIIKGASSFHSLKKRVNKNRLTNYTLMPKMKGDRIFHINAGENTLFYKIYPGNTVFQLSRAFHIPVKNFKKYVGSHRLYAYQWIGIPISKIEPYEIYRVKKGDTLIGLAKKFMTYRDSISVINHIWQPSGLKAGSYILVLKNLRKK